MRVQGRFNPLRLLCGPGTERPRRLVGQPLGQETGGSYRAELRHLLANDDDLVAGVQQNTAERNGKRLAVDLCLLFQLKDGRITEGWEHFQDLYAWDEFWS